MPSAASLALLLQELDHLDLVTSGPQLQQLSQEQFSYSPLLSARLHDCRADVVVRARCREDVVFVAAACHRYGIPLTPRGSGTGNYGQCVPLKGGVVLDTSAMTAVRHLILLPVFSLLSRVAVC